MNKISLIVAMDENRGIGLNNQIPWRSKDDLKFFSKTTANSTVIMGKNTWLSLPVTPLKNRENFVISSTLDSSSCRVFSDPLDAVKASTRDSIFVIGGSSLYQWALDSNILDTMYITHICGVYEADIFFPSISDGWKKEILGQIVQNADNNISATITKYTR